jgi:hypothetical protein
VSPTDKPLSPGATLFVMKRLAEDEAKRIEGLTDAELEAEMTRDGRAPWTPSSTEALLERVKARAAAQRRGPAQAVAAVAPEGTAHGGAAVPTRLHGKRRASRFVALLAAAIAAVAVAMLEGPAIVAYFRAPTIEPDRGHPPTPAEVARGLRDEAIEKCAAGEWKGCGDQLDEAKRIDPNGEVEARVVKARGEIEEAVGGGAKGPPEQTPEPPDLKLDLKRPGK